MKVRTMSEYTYNRQERALVHNESGIIYTDYVGVGKVANYGKQSLYQKLVKVHGKEKAENIQKRSINRGNAIHKKLELDPRNIVPNKGESIGREIFVFGRILDGCKPVQGALDDLCQDDQGRFHLIEYKTKSNPFTWAKYRKDNMEAYLMIVSAYEALIEEFYNIKLASVTLAIVFPKPEHYPHFMNIRRQTRREYLEKFKQNLSNFPV